MSCRTTVTVAGVSVDAIIGTGASRTPLSDEWYRKLVEDLPCLKPSQASLRGAGGEDCDVCTGPVNPPRPEVNDRKSGWDGGL